MSAPGTRAVRLIAFDETVPQPVLSSEELAAYRTVSRIQRVFTSQTLRQVVSTPSVQKASAKIYAYQNFR